MTDIVVISDDEPGDSVTTDDIDNATETVNEESAQRDVALADMVTSGFNALSERITQLENSRVPDPVVVEVETEVEPPTETEVIEEPAVEGTLEPVETADGERIPVVGDEAEQEAAADAEPAKKPRTKKRDKTPRQSRGWRNVLLGGSGGVRRGARS